MKCPTCKQAILRKGRAEELRKVAGHTFTAKLPAEVCSKCDEALVEAKDLLRFELAIAAWLASHGVRKPETFQFMRKAIGLPAAELAGLLEVTPETVSRWENGKLAVEARAFALLAALVADRVEGSDRTMKRLLALREPAKRYPDPVRVKLPAA